MKLPVKEPTTIFTDSHGVQMKIRRQLFNSNKFVIYTEPQRTPVECTPTELLMIRVNIEKYVRDELGKDMKWRTSSSAMNVILEMYCPHCGTLITFTLYTFILEEIVCKRCNTKFGSGAQL